jgi:hypothetical protein
MPERTDLIVNEYLKSGKQALSIYSNAVLFNREKYRGRVLFRKPPKVLYTLDFISQNKFCVQGSTHAWHRRLFCSFDPLMVEGQLEDVVIPFRALLLQGEIRYIHRPLVYYRQHNNNIYNSITDKRMANKDLTKQKKLVEKFIIAFNNRLLDLDHSVSMDSGRSDELSEIRKNLLNSIIDFNYEHQLCQANWVGRVSIIYRAYRQGTNPFRIYQWIYKYLFRFFGLLVTTIYIWVSTYRLTRKLFLVKDYLTSFRLRA